MNFDRNGNISAKEWQDLFEVGKALTSVADMDHVLDLIMEKVQSRVHAENWSLLLKDQKSGQLRFKVAKGLEPEKMADVVLEEGEGFAGWTSKTGEPLFIRDVLADERFCSKVDQMTGFKTESVICIPMKFEERVLGVIEVVNLKDFDGFVKNVAPILSGLADYAAIAVENTLLIERLNKETITDSLTGLYNDRFLMRNLHEELTLADDDNMVYSVVFLDLDNFKEVVDTHGHLAGSETLKKFARFLKKNIPEKFPLVRFGGDEFVIFMPGLNKEQAKEASEKIRESLKSAVIEPVSGTRIKLTASFGISSYPEDGNNLHVLLKKADEAMYRIKDCSKNAVGC
jgi:diguanylate cyclase (GGDEF)-like protein